MQTLASSEEGAITVVVGRFEPLVGFGLEHILSTDSRICVLASDLDCVELVRVVMQEAPDLAIIDETLEPALFEGLSDIRSATGVAVLARCPTRLYGLQRLACNMSCLAKSASAADILDAIHFIASGGQVFVTASGHRTERDSSESPLLTKRETDVLGYLIEDRRYAEIAYALGIRPETVRKHTARICQKLEIGGRQELIGMPASTRHPT